MRSTVCSNQIPEGFVVIVKIVSNSLNEIWHSLNGTAAMTQISGGFFQVVKRIT